MPLTTLPLALASSTEQPTHLFHIAALFLILTLVGVEFSVSAFINPAASHLDPAARKAFLSRMAVVLGKVMPVWYPLCAVLFGLETWLTWHAAPHGILLTADVIWLLASVASVVFLVPLNTRVAQGAPDWLPAHHTWDRRHRVRIVALAIAAVLLTSVLVR